MKKDKKHIQIIALVLLTMVCGMSGQALAEPVATQGADGNFVPVVNAENPIHSSPKTNNLSGQNSENPSVLTGPSDDFVPGDEKSPSIKDTLNTLGLNSNDMKVFTANLESGLQSLNQVLETKNVTAADRENLDKAFERLSGFAGEHGDNKNVITAVAVVVNSFIERVEKKTFDSGNKEASLSQQSNQSLLQSLLESEEADAKAAVEVYHDSGGRSEEARAAARNRDQVMDSVLEILRKGSVNPQTPAFSRAVYRSWYLSLSKKARDVRFNRLRTLVLHQQNAENPGVAL